MTLQVLYQYRLATYVPLNSSISYADLAHASGLDESRLTGIVRYLILSHIFTEPSPGHVGHSSISRLLATETQSMDFLGHTTEDVFPAAFHQTRAL
jgi:6-hydroxytryprostatin B O-methyltransferase